MFLKGVISLKEKLEKIKQSKLILQLKIVFCKVAFMRIFFVIAVFGMVVFGEARALICKSNFQNSDSAIQRTKNEEFLRSFKGDTAALFLHNFKNGDIGGENSFIVIRGTSSIGRVIKKISDNKLLIETIDSSGRLTKIEIEVGVNEKAEAGNRSFVFTRDSFFTAYRVEQSSFIIDQGNPQLEMIFQAHQSTLRRIDSNSLHVPKRDNEEQILREQGYSSVYRRGIDEAREWIEIGDQLRRLKPNPYETDMDYFKDKIEPRIDHIRKKVTNSKQKERLEKLEKEAKPRVKKKPVTYEWWVKFNFQLSDVLYPYILTPEEEIEIAQRIQNLINQFPFNILMPTTTQGYLGVLLISATYFKGILPIGLANKKTDVDAMEDLIPRKHYLHDIGHAENFLSQVRNLYTGMAHERFHDKLIKEVKNLSPEERQRIEFCYFILGHERALGFVYSKTETIKETLRFTLDSQIRKKFNFKGLMNFLSDPMERSRQINALIEDFVRFSVPLSENL